MDGTGMTKVHMHKCKTDAIQYTMGWCQYNRRSVSKWSTIDNNVYLNRQSEDDLGHKFICMDAR